jgi:hypothetical protein
MREGQRKGWRREKGRWKEEGGSRMQENEGGMEGGSEGGRETGREGGKEGGRREVN